MDLVQRSCIKSTTNLLFVASVFGASLAPYNIDCLQFQSVYDSTLPPLLKDIQSDVQHITWAMESNKWKSMTQFCNKAPKGASYPLLLYSIYKLVIVFMSCYTYTLEAK